MENSDLMTSPDPVSPPPRSPAAPAVVKGQVLLDRWRVTGWTRGGQAWVLTVDDLLRDRQCAIKVPIGGSRVSDEELIVLLRMRPHPYVVALLDVLTVLNRQALLLEYAPASLTDIIGTEFRPEILQEICAGMAHLSAMGESVHLDLKPSNILLDEAGHAKIADFGLSGLVRAPSGRFRRARGGGTWAYASPEQLRGEPCDCRADVYSFGVILYQLCTGRLPYPFPLVVGGDDDAKRRQLLDYYASEGPGERRKSLFMGATVDGRRLALPPLDGRLGWVLSSCLDEHAGGRPRDFSDLSRMLTRQLGIDPADSPASTLPWPDRCDRELALARSLIRTGRGDEAVRVVNRLLAAGPDLPAELLPETLKTARAALACAGRGEEAALLRGPEE
ncbi:serine/threonine-protein kinase [Actinoplanes sp. NPDC049802]|uniref:serine/threonine-protein kinase n=1 Tax=Actinoplanes sp. NPDC049802 TaxID=3154742 RepID=UPI0033F0A650